VNKTIKYLCCFCGQSIDSSKTDPAEISVLINFDKECDQQVAQLFYCHITCFREKLNDQIKIHFHLHNISD
jgi:hypothetical protein